MFELEAVSTLGMKDLFREITPPIIWSGARDLRDAIRKATASPADTKSDEILFSGRPEFLSELVPNARVYGEYGVGSSTIWAARNTDARILSVDTSREWNETVREAVGAGRADLAHVDLGEVGDWGRPVSYDKRSRFRDYFESIWTRGPLPDVILIDGRFRVACFLTSLLRARSGTRIIIDDYTDRTGYHVIEEFLAPDAVRDSQAVFTVPERPDREGIARELNHFQYVMD